MKENREVVDIDEQSIIIDWVNENQEKNFTINVNNYQKMENLSNIKEKYNNKKISDILENIRSRIIEKENLYEFLNENYDTEDFIYCNNPGSKLHYHTDEMINVSGKILVRFNVCIQKPVKGGRPIYSGKIIELVERSYVICKSQIEYHTSEWLSGNKPRINISYGMFIDIDKLERFSNREKVISENCILFEPWICCYPITEELNIDCCNIINNECYLLDKNKNTFDIVEKYVDDISRFHIKRKNISITEEYIEFSLITNINSISIDYDKVTKKCPLITIICFLDETSNPLIITDIDREQYTYKEIDTVKNFSLSVPKKNSHIVFDGSKYYGSFNLSNEDTSKYIKISIWDSLPKNKIFKEYLTTEFFASSTRNIIDNLEEYINLTNEHIYHINFLEELLYSSVDKEKCIEKIKFVYNNCEKTDNNIIYINLVNEENNVIDINDLINRFGELGKDIQPFINKGGYFSRTNRFQRKNIVNGALAKDVCFWIINESEKKNKWQDCTQYKNYKTYLNVELIPPVLSFILFIFNFWAIHIKNLYKIDKTMNLNIKDIFISKCTKDVNTNDINDCDGSFLVLNIALNDDIDFKDGEIHFDDGDTVRLKQGDMIIYSGRSFRNNAVVSYGEKYTLVIIIDISL